MSDQQNAEILFWNTRLSELEKLVVSGQHDQCQQQLDQIFPHQVPRAFAPQLAQIASRVQHSIFALKVLFRFVYPENSFDEPARDSEKMIYAYALSNLGAEDEALKLLETVNSEKEPEALFQKALAYVKQWNYAKTIPLLKEFIASTQVQPYRQLVAQVNLAAALICQSRWQEANDLLAVIQAKCQENEYTLLLGNSLELQAQLHFFQKNYEQALSCLRQSSNLLKEQKGIYLFFVEKWTAICQCYRSPTPENLQHLQALREQSMIKCYWDTAREFDMFRGVLEQNEELIRKVIMGTPSEAYRQRARQLYGKALRPLGQFRLLLAGANQETKRTFDPYLVSADGTSLSEKPHLLALFEALTLDFYRPHYLAALFKYVYPEERFNPTTSPARVMQLLNRLDDWFKEHQWPLYVHFKKSEFSLQSNQPIVVIIQRGKKMSATDIKWNTIREKFAGKTFSAEKISKALGVSRSSALRLIAEALEEGRIQKVGQSRGTEYRFSDRIRKNKTAA